MRIFSACFLRHLTHQFSFQRSSRCLLSCFGTVCCLASCIVLSLPAEVLLGCCRSRICCRLRPSTRSSRLRPRPRSCLCCPSCLRSSCCRSPSGLRSCPGLCSRLRSRPRRCCRPRPCCSCRPRNGARLRSLPVGRLLHRIQQGQEEDELRTTNTQLIRFLPYL